MENLLKFSDFEKNWKPKKADKTKRTETGLDIIEEGFSDLTSGKKEYILDVVERLKEIPRYDCFVTSESKYRRGGDFGYEEDVEGDWIKYEDLETVIKTITES